MRRIKEVPDGLWVKCPSCGQMLYRKELVSSLHVCSRCSHHLRLGAAERIAITTDPDSFCEQDRELASSDPLGFPGYRERLARDQQSTGLPEAMIWGSARIGGIEVSLGVMDFGFLGASMGWVVGEKVARAAEYAERRGLPLVIFATSGGARMHEGIVSLQQMAKTAAAIARLHEARLPYISVVTDPTTAGVLASFASLGDCIIAEPGGRYAFAGPRVVQQAYRITPAPDAYTGEFLLEHGMADLVAPRREMRSTLISLLSHLRDRWPAAPVAPQPMEGEGR